MDNQNPLTSDQNDQISSPHESIDIALPILPPTPPVSQMPPMTPLTPIAPTETTQSSTTAWAPTSETQDLTLPGPTTVTTEETNVAPETILKPKKRILPAVTAAIVLLLVAGVAGSAYYVSTQMSQRTAIAPTAPESEPMAAGLDAEPTETVMGNENVSDGAVSLTARGECVTVNVGIRNSDGKWTRIKPEEAAAKVKRGDTIRLLAKGSPDVKEMRFRIVDSLVEAAQPGEWKMGSPGGANPEETGEFYVEVAIEKTGKYSFEAQAR